MRKLCKRLLLFILCMMLMVAISIVGLGYLGYRDQLDANPLDIMVQSLQAKKNYIELQDMNPYLVDAVYAIEDRRFYSHHGIDYIGVVRAVVVNISKQGSQGGSTISQQLAKQFYFAEDNDGIRKVSEAFIAKRLEREYSKDMILEMYININYYGDGFDGIYEASMGYFNVSPKQLSLAQASMLAGLVQAPSIYALSNQDERSYQRQRQVLSSMLELELISKEEYANAIEETNRIKGGVL
ncbi:MAG: transglycosylase domain-containing protein [Breznakia sp.]